MHVLLGGGGSDRFRSQPDAVIDHIHAGIDDVPVVVGGIIPKEDASALKDAGVAEVYTPKDFELNRIMSDVVRIVESTAAARD